MIDVSPEQLKIVTGILAQFVPECEVRFFGSRVNGNPKSYSDLDWAVVGKEKNPIRTLGQFREAFEASETAFLCRCPRLERNPQIVPKHY